MKRIVSILLSIMLCFISMMAALPVGAMSAQADVEICKGETVEVNVIEPENVSAKAGSIEFEYGNEFEFVSGDWTLSDTTMKRYTASTKKGVFTFDSEHSIVGNVFVLNLKSSDDISLGKHSITYSVTLRNAEGLAQSINGNCVVDVVNQNEPVQVDAEIAIGERIAINVVIPESVMAKAGSIEFVYSDDFEFISGDWSLQNTTMKRYTPSTNKGVFTFESEQSVVGTVFVINLKATDNIMLGEHCISYSVTLRNADGISRIFDGNYYVNVIGIQVLGDADGDGDITILDATVIQRYLAAYTVKNPEHTVKCGDVNGEGLDIIDATLIQRYLASFTVPYSIGKPINT